MKKLMGMLSLALCFFMLASCGNTSTKTDSETEKTEIVMGVTGGPYNDLFNEAILPILEKEGYTVKDVSFSQFMQSNTALADGEIDVNVAQHTAYMKVFNNEKNTDLVPLVATPSVPCSLYSSKYTSADEIQNGMTVGIPQDPSNAARAYAVLADTGWIEVDPDVAKTELTAANITANPYNLDIKEMDSSTLPRVLDDLDFEVIPGSVVEDAGVRDKLNLIYEEKIIPDLEIVVAVKEENENKPWAQAIKAAYQSQEFKDYMAEHNTDNYWVMPQS